MKPTVFKLCAGAGVLAALATPAAGVAYQWRTTRREDETVPGLGERVDVGGYRLHVRTEGLAGDGPTVVFESGMSCPLEVWSWIQPEIARDAPAVAYDRAGLGWSERGPRPRTADEMLAELETVLEVSGAKPPYVLVGHSFGGLLVRHFAQRHPELTAGVVLVDASHPEQLVRSARQALGLPLMKATIQDSTVLATFGVNRLSKRYVVSDVEYLPSAARAAACARMLTRRTWRTTGEELRSWLTDVNDKVRDAKLPADLPLAVLTAGEVSRSDPVHNELQDDLAALSANSRRLVVSGASHLGLIMREQFAKYVTEAVADVVRAARAGGRMDSEPTQTGSGR
ncbi:alpha/beta hydrolase [Amycolatopsis vastitatis]|uniref:Alpha/beta hydrolase n=1 Tax=Amycolatopsis vastitatis TaxID=1905142 RepID=A0A229TBE2_9PSEU|nr:alpha/beta hydrolase [Amycolatopsis vastitatis]OXM68433.1 alpha/beta hydrolase [Amycolatopsis vastitatis]